MFGCCLFTFLCVYFSLWRNVKNCEQVLWRKYTNTNIDNDDNEEFRKFPTQKNEYETSNWICERQHKIARLFYTQLTDCTTSIELDGLKVHVSMITGWVYILQSFTFFSCSISNRDYFSVQSNSLFHFLYLKSSCRHSNHSKYNLVSVSRHLPQQVSRKI